MTWREKNREYLAQKCREWREKNKERKQAYCKQWDSENRERKNANRRAWAAKNPEKEREYDRQKYEKHKDRIRAYRAKWARERYANDPIRAAAPVHKRRVLKDASSEQHTSQEIAGLWIRQGFKCAIAGCAHPISDEKGRNRYHVDHIQPLCKGGSNGIGNIQLLCRFHNQSKGGNDPYKWAQKKLGRLFL